MIRVTIVTPRGDLLGGAEGMLWSFLRGMDPARIEPSVAYLEGGALVRETADLGIPTMLVRTGRLRDVRAGGRAVRRLARHLRERRPDLVLGWMSKAQLYAAPAAALAGCADRVVWWQHGIPGVHWMDRSATLLPTLAVGCSSAASAEAQRRLRPVRPVFVVHPGIEPREPARPRAVVRAELGIAPDRVVIGLLGRLHPMKGQDRLLRALALLRRVEPRVHGLLVGGDAFGLAPHYGEQVRALVKALGLSADVTTVGQVGNARDYVGAMDVLVNATDGEPFGITLLEGMSAAAPVVAVARGGPAEIIEPGQTGVLVPDSAPATLARALEPLVRHEDLRRRMGRAGRARVERSFSAERMCRALETQLELLAG